MLGTLNDYEITELLSRQVIGHLACSLNDESYIVPINYVYKNDVLYVHSGPGKKVDMMRKNPKVSVGVDEIETIFRWKSVVCRGLFEEITDPDEKQQAKQLITHRIMPLVNNPAGHASHGIGAEKEIGHTIQPIYYKIIILEKTGRFEYA